MRDALTRRVDPWRAARAGTRLAGTLDGGRLPRLAAIAEPVGPLEVSLDFAPWQAAGGARVTAAVRVAMHAAGRLRSTCQRCLEPVEFAADLDTEVVLTPHEAPGDDTDHVVVPAGELVDLAALVEDELILSLPFAPAHADGECAQILPRVDAPAVERRETRARRDNPFAALGALKRRESGDKY